MFYFLLGEDLGVRFLGYIISIGLPLQETAQLFSKVAILFCIPTNNVPVTLMINDTDLSCAYLSFHCFCITVEIHCHKSIVLLFSCKNTVYSLDVKCSFRYM